MSTSVVEATTASIPEKRFRLLGLDGLRALAALAVLGYHLLPQYFPGGFLGVDVFFVISGFLITALLAKEFRRRGVIDIRRFWKGRFRRIFPAVAFTVVISVALATVVSSDLLVGIRRQLIGSLTFTYNWLEIFQGVSYFDHSNPQFLRNMWSLALEQQFYLLWPVVLIIILRAVPERRQWWVPAILSAAATVETALLAHFGAGITRIYQGADTHSLGIMLGAALALAFPQALDGALPAPSSAPPAKRGFTPQLRAVLAWVGLAGVGLSFFFFAEELGFIYPWGLLAASVLTALIIQGLLAEVVAGSRGGKILVALLNNRPMVWLGERSYSLYLWHWPIFMLVRAGLPTLSPLPAAALITVTSLITADLTFRFIENPMRRDGMWATIRGWFSAAIPGATGQVEGYQPPRKASGQASAAAGATATRSAEALIGGEKSPLAPPPPTSQVGKVDVKVLPPRRVHRNDYHPAWEQGQSLEYRGGVHYGDMPADGSNPVAFVKPLSKARYLIALAPYFITSIMVSLLAVAWVSAPDKTSAQLVVEAGAKSLHQTALPTPAPSAAPSAAPSESASAAPSPTSSAAPVAADPNQVTIIGDSVTLASAPALQQALPGAYIDAQVSRFSRDGLKIVQEMAKRGILRPYLVFSLATNGDFTLKEGHDLLTAVGPQVKVVLVTGYGPAVDPWIERSNTVIRTLASEFPQQVRIADWNAAIAPQAHLLASDHVHPGGEGGVIFANTVKAALDSFPAS